MEASTAIDYEPCREALAPLQHNVIVPNGGYAFAQPNVRRTD